MNQVGAEDTRLGVERGDRRGTKRALEREIEDTLRLRRIPNEEIEKLNLRKKGEGES